MMANVSDCGELHNELWNFRTYCRRARVPLPYYVLIDVPELDDALEATHSTVESAKVCYASPLLKDSAPGGSPEYSFGRPAMEAQISAVQEHSVPVNAKTSTD